MSFQSPSTSLPLRRLMHSLTALTVLAGLTTAIGCDTEEVAETNGAATAVEPGQDVQVQETEQPEAQVAAFAQEQRGVEGAQTSESSGEAITVSKSLPEQIVLGTPLTYQVNVQAAEDLNGVIVREELPEGFEYESSQPEGQLSENGRILSFQIGQLSADQTREIQITGTPQQVGSLRACTTYDFQRGVCSAFQVVNPQLTLVKQGPEQASVCEAVTYTYAISNDGDTEATNVTIYDRLPEGLMTAEGEREVQFDIGTLAAGQQVEKQIQIMAEQATDFTSYAYAESNLDEVRSKQVSTQFIAPELQVQARALRPFEYVGKQAQFEVTVENVGQASSAQTVASIAIEGNGELASINGQRPGDPQLAAAEGEQQIEVSDNAINLGALPPGERRTFTVEVAADEPGRIRLGAAAAAVCPRTEKELATAQANAALQVRALSALHITAVDKVDPVRVGEETVYEISIANEGSADDTNLQVQATLPEGVTFVSAEGPTQAQAEGRQLTFQPLESLASGEMATWYVTVRAEEATGSTTLSVQATSDRVNETVTAGEPTRLY